MVHNKLAQNLHFYWRVKAPSRNERLKGNAYFIIQHIWNKKNVTRNLSNSMLVCYEYDRNLIYSPFLLVHKAATRCRNPSNIGSVFLPNFDVLITIECYILLPPYFHNFCLDIKKCMQTLNVACCKCFKRCRITCCSRKRVFQYMELKN